MALYDFIEIIIPYCNCVPDKKKQPHIIMHDYNLKNHHLHNCSLISGTNPIGAFSPFGLFVILGEATISFNLCESVLSHCLIILLHHSSEVSAVAYIKV